MAVTKITVNALSKGTTDYLIYGKNIVTVKTVGYNQIVTRDKVLTPLINTMKEIGEELKKAITEESKYGNLVMVLFQKDGVENPDIESYIIFGPWGFNLDSINKTLVS